MISGDALRELLADNGVDAARFAPSVDFTHGAVERLLPGTDVIEVWRRLRLLMPQSGRAPIVVAGPSPADVQEALETSAAEFGATLAQAASFDAESWLANRYEGDDLDDLDDEDDLAALAEEFGMNPEDLPAIEPGATARFSLPYEVLSGKPLANVEILLLPSDRSWEAPAYLSFGGWNECPWPFEQVATLALWQRRYGAEVFGLGGDLLELEVAHPPADEDAARTLAIQQYAFCPDLVDQGYLSISRLARAVEGGGSWSFWWD